jgi:hypothetical protein
MFQTRYFSETVVVPGIEPWTSESVARNSWQLDHRGVESLCHATNFYAILIGLLGFIVTKQSTYMGFA